MIALEMPLMASMLIDGSSSLLGFITQWFVEESVVTGHHQSVSGGHQSKLHEASIVLDYTSNLTMTCISINFIYDLWVVNSYTILYRLYVVS